MFNVQCSILNSQFSIFNFRPAACDGDGKVFEFVCRFKKPVFGVMLLRFDPIQKTEKMDCLKELIALYSSKLKGYFTVVDSEKFGIRPLQSRQMPGLWRYHQRGQNHLYG